MTETYDPVTQEVKAICHSCSRFVKTFTMNQYGDTICVDCENKLITGVWQKVWKKIKEI